ncbi:DUF423 domain-containing protein [Micromonospora sp. DR5-3]|uniref:DUF423 domain-containing protein n=1 Tax=unclassified Micromonospora TaxID=2617518 RepID=UPI002106715C|nr:MULTISPECIES: DUF423 domain-containing protein [unclassified Micromonospora]MCW3814224.1 DUF423 domain-containing protein [Micromonospora sp. DR5-3]
MTAGVRQEPREAACPRTPWRHRLPVLLALLVGVAGVGYRLALLLADAPPTNSDEATMGLAALHIARGQDFPVWFYGQAYMGTLEAYLAAPLVALAGPSVLVLRLPTLALYALFLALSWRLTRRLRGDRWFALLVVGFLALGSDRVIKNQLIAGGGYPELNPAGVALALLTVGLCAGASGRCAGGSGRCASGPGRCAGGSGRCAGGSGRPTSSRAAPPGPGERAVDADPSRLRAGARLLRWAAWGLVSGLMLWVDPLLLPYVLGTGAVLVARRRRELAGRAGLVVVTALLLGAAPMLLDSLRHGRNPLAAVLAAGGGDAAAGWGERLYGGLVLGPPLGMGFCSPSHCAGWQLWWAVAFPLLLLLAALAAWRTLRTRSPGGLPDDAGTGTPAGGAAGELGHVPFGQDGKCPRSGQLTGGDDRWVSAAVRLALLAGAAAVLLAYTVSSAAGQTPVESARYLSCLAVATPALLWPLWQLPFPRQVGDLAVSGSAGHHHLADVELISAEPAGERGPAEGGRRVRVAALAAVAVLAATLGTAGVATAGSIARVPAVHAEADRHRALVDTLGELGVRHVRGGYWTCNRLTFATGEDVVCAVVDDELRPGFDRLPAYRRAVAADPGAAWVAPVGSPLAARLDQRLGPDSGALDVVTVAGWRVYLPRP